MPGSTHSLLDRRPTLQRRLFRILVVKALALFILWWAFFSGPGPVTDGGRTVAAALFGAEAQP